MQRMLEDDPPRTRPPPLDHRLPVQLFAGQEQGAAPGLSGACAAAAASAEPSPPRALDGRRAVEYNSDSAAP